jgi:hypothetical protein
MISMVPAIDQSDQAGAERPGDGSVEFVAMLSEVDFEAARAVIADFALYADYEDWLDDRYGMVVGLCSSGVDARMMTVEVARYLAWSRYAKLTPSEKGLDEFVSAAAIVCGHLRADVDLTTIATVSQAEFSAYFDLLEAFQVTGDYANWLARREAAVQGALASGAIVCRAPAPIAEFLEWTRCLGERSSEALLDRYAALTLETFILP